MSDHDEMRGLNKMNVSLTIPQLFYDMIARVFPGFLFLFMMRVCLVGTFIDPSSIILSGSTTSWGLVLDGIEFMVLCYFAGWSLRGLTWPDLRPDEKKHDLKTKFQRIRLQHPEAGYRIVKLRAEAKLLSSSRTGMLITSILALFAWIFHKTEEVSSLSIPHYSWSLRIGLPLLLGIIFYGREKRWWGHYCGNVKKLHKLIIEDGYPRKEIIPQNGNKVTIMDKKYVCPCGLICKECLFYKPEIYETAKTLRDKIQNAELDVFLTSISKDKKAKMIANHLNGDPADFKNRFAAFKKFEQFMDTLEGLVALQCKSTCRESGGCLIGGELHKCDAVKCVASKGYEGCWECPEHKQCNKLSFVKEVYGDTIDETFKAMASEGRNGVKK